MVFITSTLCYHDWKTLTLFTYSSVLSMSHLSGRDYSNVFLYSLGRERENRYLFSLFSAVALTWQHIKNSKEEKTHGASDGVSAWGEEKKPSGRNSYKMRLFECALQQWLPEKLIQFEGESAFDPTAKCKVTMHSESTSLFFC